MTDRRVAIAERIASAVEVVDGGYISLCWLWTKGDSGKGKRKRRKAVAK